MKFKYDVQTLQWIALFEKVTRSRLKDCMVHAEKIFFIVEPGNLKKALGKNKQNVQKLETMLKHRIKIVEYSETMTQFITNIMAPLRIVEIKQDDDVVTITGPDQKTKGLMIGARAQNLRNYEKMVQKYFPELKEIKVV